MDRLSGLVADIMNDRGKAWFVTLDRDVAQLNPPYGTAVWRGLDFVAEPRRALLQRFLDRQPSKTLALEPARQWLASLATQPPTPVTQGDWSAISELSYWTGRWFNGGRVGSWLRAIELAPLLDQLPLQLVSDLLRGRWELDGETMGPWLSEQREHIAARFRKETDTVWIEDRQRNVRSHFLVSRGIIGADDKQGPDEDANRKDRLHAEAIWRVELMRGLFPDQAGYGCQGYGHKFLPMPYDGTTKTSVPPDRLPPVWATRINAFANRMIEWRLRPAEWADYLSQVSSVRKDTTFVMRDLLRALIAHFKNKRKHKAVGARLNAKAWDSLRDKLGKEIPLPQQAVDEWGFVTEGLESNGQNNAQRIEQGFALSAYSSYLKSQSDLFTGLNNFLNQAIPHLYLHCSDGKASIEISRMLIEAKMNEVGDNLVKPALVFHNLVDVVAALPRFQREFRRLFGGQMRANQLDDQDRRERKIFDAVLPLLNAYLETPAAHWQDPERRAMAKMWHAVDQVPRRLAVALASLESGGIQAKILILRKPPMAVG